jgi:glutathione S-transferase
MQPLKPIELYIDWISQPSRAVTSFCKMAKIPFVVIETPIMGGATRSAEYAKINPDRKVPAMREPDSGYALFESHAIMRYLASQHQNQIPDNLYPRDHQERALVDAYLDWHHSNTRKAGWLLYNSVIRPQLGLEATSVDLESLKKDVQRSINFIENYFLKDKKYIHGLEDISIADISCYCELVQLQLIGYSFQNYRNISLWMNRVGSIPEIQEAHRAFNQLLRDVTVAKKAEQQPSAEKQLIAPKL